MSSNGSRGTPLRRSNLVYDPFDPNIRTPLVRRRNQAYDQANDRAEHVDCFVPLRSSTPPIHTCGDTDKKNNAYVAKQHSSFVRFQDAEAGSKAKANSDTKAAPEAAAIQVSFAKSIRNLHAIIAEAGDFYKDIICNFESACEKVINFTTEDILEGLWYGNIRSTKDNARQILPNLETRAGKIRVALKAVMDSIGGEKLGKLNQSAVRMADWVRMGGTDVLGYLDSAASSYEMCWCLIEKMEALMLMTDPDKRSNKKALAENKEPSA